MRNEHLPIKTPRMTFGRVEHQDSGSRDGAHPIQTHYQAPAPGLYGVDQPFQGIG
jgi:hypothetical protein